MKAKEIYQTLIRNNLLDNRTELERLIKVVALVAERSGLTDKEFVCLIGVDIKKLSYTASSQMVKQKIRRIVKKEKTEAI